MAAEHGVDIASLSGSGISGRVTKKDLTAFLESGAAAPASATRPSMYAPAGFDYQPPVVTPWPGDVVEPMSKIRKLTAGHMAYSKQTSAHVTTVFEVDLTRVTRVRDKLRPEFDARGDKLTYLPFVIQQLQPEPARGLPRRWPAPALDDGPHLSYAIQWFSFAIIVLAGTAALLRRPGRSRTTE